VNWCFHRRPANTTTCVHGSDPTSRWTPRRSELARVADFRELIDGETTYRFTLVVDTQGVGLQVLRGDGLAAVFRDAPPCLGDYTREELLAIAQCL